MKAVLLVLGVLTLAAGMQTPAQAQNYPWCAMYSMPDAPLNCGFVSFDQCMLTVRGMGGFCMANNTYQPPIVARQTRKHSSHS